MYSYNKKLALICLSMLLLNSVEAQQRDQVQLTLNQVWDKVTANNKSLKIQDLRVLGSIENIKDAKAERLPDINAEGEYARVSNLPIYENGLFHAPKQFEVVHTSYSFGGDAYFNVYNGNKTNIKIAGEKKESELAI
jgi:outer membrane protein